MANYTNAAGRVYVTGLTRRHPKGGLAGDYVVAHLFDGTFGEPGNPLCHRAYDQDGDWSIWRGNVGSKGICKVCKRRADAGMNGVEFAEKEDA